MKKIVMIGIALVLGVVSGMYISPLLAQSQAADAGQMNCVVGEASNAACSGQWIYFAGNTGTLDESAWVIRVNSETGEIWYKNGKRLQLLKDVSRIRASGAISPVARAFMSRTRSKRLASNWAFARSH